MTAPAPSDLASRAALFAALVVMGAGWGITQPLGKIAVSEGHRAPGLVFWQLAIGAVVLGLVMALRRRRIRWDGPAMRVYLLIALIGTVLPNSASFEAIRHLPSGLISILLSLVPVFAFPIALILRNEKFQPVRLMGLLIGLAGVLIIVAPGTSLPDRAMIVFVPLALIAPLFYALEGNVVARWGTAGLDPIEVLFGGSVVGAIVALPIAVGTNSFIDPMESFGAPEWALVASSLIHAAVYTTYVWMVGRAGPVFAVQVSYLVTGFGVFWALLILGERYSLWVWAAMAVILAGVLLVQPRQRTALERAGETGQPSTP
ncbi:EamA family transporter [Alphaproteobacteria bacterium GH1-50]|uniref:EamA family transporter n=1 Tax=Kangsaoukella pontilimi TaxID=2691042 RepID=A0A7C9IE57_9RHOB|nr:DMT family transporter [Kangsaoukella pontilimi]MXQ06508.1 EamA family transporter [Kangsaoukella pontilimi]